jgi:hypothetical protein
MNVMNDIVETTKAPKIAAFYQTQVAEKVFGSRSGRILSEKEAKDLFINTLKELT